MPRALRLRPSVALLLLTLLPLPSFAADAPKVTFTPLKPTGIYNVGEKAGWTITVADAPSAGQHYAYTLKKNNADVIKSGNLDFADGKATVDVTLDEPAMLYLQVTPPGEKKTLPNGQPIAAGAAVAPTKLQPVTPRPSDFDEFWAAKVKEAQSIPLNPELTPGDAERPNVDYATLRLDHVNGHHVYAQMAKPKKEGKFPALLIFQWASPPYPLQKPWVTQYAADGWLAVNVEPHDVKPTEPKAYYDALPQAIKNYNTIGQDDREKSYFLQMYLGDYRAIDYVTSRPDWDGKTLVVMGTSMGGQQSLCVAGLHPKVTHLIVDEPAGCDLNAPLHHRQNGYPFFPGNNPKVMQTALYFDAVNFAPNIHAKSLVAMGFVDNIAPPAGIWTAFNEIPAPKEAAPMIDSPHNNYATPQQQMPYTKHSAQWLHELVTGHDVETGNR